jgi:TRAP-type C4-dicarboxylate transport system permease small subunit
MNSFSSILRIVCGVVLIILGYSTYSRNAAHIAAGEPMQVFGHLTNAEPRQLTLAFAVIGLIGLFLIVLGCVNLLKRR